jgi:DNA-binding transcriptional ArsR family regulator
MTTIPHSSVTPPTTQARRDPLTLAGLGIVALAAAATSFSTLAELARDAGWSRIVSPALPVIVDVLAAVSTRAWLSGPASVRPLARRTAVLAIVVSVLGNAAAHLIAAGLLRPGIGLVITVAMTPPIALGVVAHLAASLSVAAPRTAPQTQAESAAAPVVASVPVPVAAAGPVLTAARADTTPDTSTDTETAVRPPARRADTAARVARLAAKHPDASAAELARRLGVSDRTVRRHLSALATA